MIQLLLESLRYGLRARRYREISAQIIEVLTRETQVRIARTLADAYLKATAQDSTDEDRKKFSAHIGQVNMIMGKDNAARIRQWTLYILEEEERYINGNK